MDVVGALVKAAKTHKSNIKTRQYGRVLTIYCFDVKKDLTAKELAL
jgi:hypothetical protein